MIEHATPGIIVSLLLVSLVIYRCLRSGTSFVRRLPAVEAVYEAVGRSAELGRPVSFTTGLSNVGPVLYAAMGVLFAVAQTCAKYRTKLFVPQNDPPSMAIVENVTKEAYRSVGLSSHFDPRSIVFLSEEQFAYASGYMGLIHRENVGAAFMFGAFAGESLILAEAGQQVGAMQIAASVSPEQVAFFIATCDYTLIGEELFAASAYLSEDPIQRGSVRAQDLIKVGVFFLIIIGVLCATLQSIFPQFTLSPSILLTGGW